MSRLTFSHPMVRAAFCAVLLMLPLASAWNLAVAPSHPTLAIKIGPKLGGVTYDAPVILSWSSLRDGNSHNPHNVPIVVGGRGGGALAPGRHVTYGDDTPLTNLYVTMLNAVGVKTDHFADSTGPLAGAANPDYKPS